MQTAKANPTIARHRTTNYLFLAFILFGLVSLGLYLFNSYRALNPSSQPMDVTTLSQQVLEEQYGLRVNLVALTAAGGMVDLRLKIVDGEKAKLLLQDKKNFPSVFVNENVTLNVSEDTKAGQIQFVNDGNLFLMFPNTGNTVKRGTKVTILFGGIALEPIEVK